MTSLELLKEIEAWLCFNTEPSKEETAKLRKSISDHIGQQLNLPPVIVTLPDQYPDNEADGYVFCGKCGKIK